MPDRSFRLTSPPALMSALMLALALALPLPALANDSAAAIGLGGLALTRSDAISMDEEDLYISQKEVRVRYRFTNRSARDIETLVSFTVPDLPGGIPGGLGDRQWPDYRQLDFRTTVDGLPVPLDHVEQAVIGSRDVTARIAALGWPLRWYASFPETPEFLQKLTAEQKAQYVGEGLLARSAEFDALLPAWRHVTHVTRRQVFRAGRSVEVTHRYAPLAGASVGGAFDPEYRGNAYFPAHARKYCVDAAFLAAVDRRLGGKPQGQRPFYMEHWLSYILSSGANWRGPIGRFRLVVDKGRPDSLVSFCMDGVRRISPTRFEVRKANFEPRKDIEVLILQWGTPEN